MLNDGLQHSSTASQKSRGREWRITCEYRLVEYKSILQPWFSISMSSPVQWWPVNIRNTIFVFFVFSFIMGATPSMQYTLIPH